MHRGLSIFVFLVLSTCGYGQASYFADTDDGLLHYQVYGQGPPILLINGGPGLNFRGFEALAETIAEKGYRVILYDQRGTGLSEMDTLSSEKMRMRDMVRDMESIRMDLHLDRWIVFGHSFGGMLANAYASSHPDCVSAMVASSSGGVDLQILDGFDVTTHLEPEDVDSLRHYDQILQSGRSTNRVQSRRNYFLAKAYVFFDVLADSISHRFSQIDRQINRWIWADLRRNEFDCSSELKKINAPVLILQGTQDIIDTSLALKAHRIFPNSQLLLLDSCAHYGWLDQPELYFRGLFDFLSSATDQSGFNTCDSTPYRAFDFWLGDWQIYGRQGNLKGWNRISTSLNGCVIKENWTSANKLTRGESVNFFDSSFGQWHQTWVDNQGGSLQLSGFGAEGMMKMRSSIDSTGRVDEIQWTRSEAGEIIQKWTRSYNGGKDWEEVFYGIYRRGPVNAGAEMN